MRLDNIKTQLIFGSSILIVGLLLGWLIFGGSGSVETHGHASQQDENKTAEETIWTCSMHPQIRQPEPGDCPICGMELIPLENEEEEEANPAAISMSPTAMQLADISTAVVNTTQPVKEVRLNGKVHADERLVFSQSSHIPGRIEKLMVNFTGEFVQKGQNIALIYSPELVTAQEELFEAQKIKETQPQLFAAAKEKLKNWKLNDAQISQILENGTPREQFAIQADVSGYVTEKMVNLGDYIKRGEAIYEIADLSRVWVLFDVYESDMPWVNKGDKVEFTVASLPGQTFEGTVSYIDPVINPQTRVSKARVEFRNTDQKLKPEMFASGTISATLESEKEAIVIPKSAVMWTGERSVVYVRQPTEKGISFVMREVVLGPSLGDSYLVESGLSEHEEIAIHGTFSIDAAAQLAGKPSMMNPSGGAVSTGHNHGNMDMGNDSDADHSGHSNMGNQGAQQTSQNVEHTTFSVAGNCEMCKNRIEEAATSVNGVQTADWDIDSKQLHLAWNSEKTSVDEVHEAIAQAGHDTEKEKAPDEVYENLPACCKYTRSTGVAEQPDIKQAEFNVSGNCEMCKSTIEEAAGNVAGVNEAVWNMNTKQIHVSYDTEKTSLDAIHKAIAAAGYDTEKEKASQEAYDNLPSCCQYTR